MASSRKRPLPAWKLPKGPKRKLPRRARALRTAWILFFVFGVPLAFMAALGPLAYSGIYIEPLRQFWQPWPPDVLKGIGSAAGFAATLAYLLYRKGRYTGYRSGAISERATARNRSRVWSALRTRPHRWKPRAPCRTRRRLPIFRPSIRSSDGRRTFSKVCAR